MSVYYLALGSESTVGLSVPFHRKQLPAGAENEVDESSESQPKL